MIDEIVKQKLEERRKKKEERRKKKEERRKKKEVINEKLILFSLFLGGASSNEVTKALKANGFNDVKTHVRVFFIRSEDDTFNTKFMVKK
ncbi:hypothetical protein [Acinetobacter pittii]|uniref:hypothetical protein n=1 Tax=Acinetobacter pittii TaxID=48296 RepID=UPI0021CDA3D2|nr:hypothetical protein [Acinetobacter pittii]